MFATLPLSFSFSFSPWIFLKYVRKFGQKTNCVYLFLLISHRIFLVLAEDIILSNKMGTKHLSVMWCDVMFHKYTFFSTKCLIKSIYISLYVYAFVWLFNDCKLHGISYRREKKRRRKNNHRFLYIFFPNMWKKWERKRKEVVNYTTLKDSIPLYKTFWHHPSLWLDIYLNLFE